MKRSVLDTLTVVGGILVVAIICGLIFTVPGRYLLAMFGGSIQYGHL